MCVRNYWQTPHMTGYSLMVTRSLADCAQVVRSLYNPLSASASTKNSCIVGSSLYAYAPEGSPNNCLSLHFQPPHKPPNLTTLPHWNRDPYSHQTIGESWHETLYLGSQNDCHASVVYFVTQFGLSSFSLMDITTYSNSYIFICCSVQ